MTRSHDDRPDEQPLDALAGLRPAEDPALAAFLAAEREAFAAAAEAEAVDAEAIRMAAWIRDTVQRDEAAAARRAATEASAVRAPARGWARILAFSVGLHVLVLGVLGVVLVGSVGEDEAGPTAHVGLGGAFVDDERSAADRYAEHVAGVQYMDLVNRDLGQASDAMAMVEQETLVETLERLEIDEPVGWGATQHPPEVTVPMVRRRNDGLKKRRLDLLGYNTQGTLRAVDRGLGVLALRQDADTGWFGGDERSAVRKASLATLAFLGEGHTSTGTRERDEVVARAVKALRTKAVDDASVATLDGASLGTLTVALAEDYMLAYGNLTLRGAAVRATELERLAEAARGRLVDGAALSGAQYTWLLWGLDAAQRAGVVAASPAERTRFDGWVASASAEAAAASSESAQAALAHGTALLYAERGAKKPRFKRWSRAHAAALLRRLKPTGEVRQGDPVADTALVLLALQTAYRTY